MELCSLPAICLGPRRILDQRAVREALYVYVLPNSGSFQQLLLWVLVQSYCLFSSSGTLRTQILRFSDIVPWSYSPWGSVSFVSVCFVSCSDWIFSSVLSSNAFFFFYLSSVFCCWASHPLSFLFWLFFSSKTFVWFFLISSISVRRFSFFAVAF